MHFKSNDKLYTDKALKHFHSFVEEYKLFDKNDSLFIGVSAGVDSMVLAYLVYQLRRYGYSNEITLIYINHNTRKEQKEEQELVEGFAKYLGVHFIVHQVHNLNPHKNFEHQARQARYQGFQRYMGINDLLLLAHHINDSYEWSILQGLRSSQLKSVIGIPVVNKKIRRPLMCLTKRQILKIAQTFDLPYLEDPTNDQVKYERNYLRHKFIKALANRHPSYLKHYVNRHTELARKLNLHQLYKSQCDFKAYIQQDFIQIVNPHQHLDYSGLHELIVDSLKKLTGPIRGNLYAQLSKIIQAMKNYKQGPLSISGGVLIYTEQRQLLVIKQDFKIENNLRYYDKHFNYDEFINFLKKNKWPLFIGFKDKQYRRGFSFSQKPHALFERVKMSGKEDGLRYISVSSMMRQWVKDKNRNKKLKLRFFTPE